MTLLDLYELIDGPLSESSCLLGYLSCPLGGCVLGDAVHGINEHVRQVLGSQRIAELADVAADSSG
jgi:DNA-binding IscR family transcriptional regulator